MPHVTQQHSPDTPLTPAERAEDRAAPLKVRAMDLKFQERLQKAIERGDERQPNGDLK